MFYVSKNVVKVNMVMKVRDKLFNNNVTKACQFMFQGPALPPWRDGTGGELSMKRMQ